MGPKGKENENSQKFNFREAYERLDAISKRMTEMATALENDKEREELTDAEKAEYRQLEREQQVLDMKIKANTQFLGYVGRENMQEMNVKLREAINSGKRFEMRVKREDAAAAFGGNTSGYSLDNPLTSANPYTITTGDIVQPLRAKTILQAIGQPLLTGLKGNYRWPVVESFEATINDEGVSLGDTKIPVSSLVARPERVGIAVPITRETINETDGLIQTVCTEQMPQAIAALVNKAEFSRTKLKVYEDGKETAKDATNLVGPFVDVLKKAASKKKIEHNLTYSGDAPTLKDLIGLKSAVLGEDVMPEGLAYVMTETTKGLLEGTPKWEGANVAIVDDNGRINGVPVFTTSYAEEGTVYFGAFKYAPMGLFGDMTIIVDPYSQARKNAIDFVLNVDFAITVLRKEAFAILTKAAGTGA